MEKFARIIINHPKSVLLAIFLLTFVIALGIPKLKTRNNYDAELPQNNPIVIANKKLSTTFGNKDMIMVGIQTDNIFNAKTLQKIAAITSELKTIEKVVPSEVLSLSTVKDINGENDNLTVGPMITDIPQTKRGLDSLRSKVMTNELVFGKLVSKDLSTSLIMATIETGYNQVNVYNKVYAIIHKYEMPEKIFATGEPIMQQELDAGIQDNMRRLLPLAIIAMIIVFFLAFRSASGCLLPLTVVILSIIWTMGLMGHFGFPLTVVSSAVPMLLIAMTSSYGIHIINRYYEELRSKDKPEALLHTTSTIALPVLMAGLTSALGSATLMTFRIASIREYGIIIGMGIFAGMMIALLFIPSMLALIGRPKFIAKEWKPSAIDRFLKALVSGSFKQPVVVLSVTAVIVGISLIGIHTIRVGADYLQYFPQKHRIYQVFETFNNKLGGSRYFKIMIDGKEPDAIKNPELLNKMLQFQAYAESLPGIGYATSFANTIKKINMALHNNDIAFNKIPESRDMVAQYLLLYSMAADPADIDNWVDNNYQKAKLLILVKTSEQDDHKRIYKLLNDYALKEFGDKASVDFGGMLMLWIAQMHYIVVGKIENIIQGLLIIWLFCAVILRSKSAGTLAIFPVIVGTATTFGLMGFLGIRLEMATAIITSIIVGVGVDFGIHFVTRLKEESVKAASLQQAIEQTGFNGGRAIFFNMIANIIGFSVFIFSGFLPVRFLGWLVSFSMLSVTLSTFVLIPALIALKTPRFLKTKNPKPAADTF